MTECVKTKNKRVLIVEDLLYLVTSKAVEISVFCSFFSTYLCLY